MAVLSTSEALARPAAPDDLLVLVGCAALGLCLGLRQAWVLGERPSGPALLAGTAGAVLGGALADPALVVAVGTGCIALLLARGLRRAA